MAKAHRKAAGRMLCSPVGFIPMFGKVRTCTPGITWWHWGMVWFIILHVYAALREDIMSRQTMVSAIVSGSRTFRD